ncbi:cobalamin-dependent protein [Actinokineospora sp. NBRC 105648]|uniref:cobalamin-dependent protein n=1 Tax=Actinokineospora sp. NBRC 105648 TaxID=3032206 RepID=UPI0024A2F4A7|nr:cobalamin-dependent protein [Actinokineospora sp. NBRC 105648]GLZ39385.1 methylaspartate mutase [Actinokineospora sp. NBRC 105648]
MRDTTFRPRRALVLGVAASDAHAVANRLIHLMLTEQGFRVRNLGVCTPLAEFADAAAELDAAAVIIGSVNGHAVNDLADLPGLRAMGRLACPVVFGGRPSIEVGGAATGRARLRELGVDHVLDRAEQLPALLDSILAPVLTHAG